MALKGYTVNGSREIIEVGIEALEALRDLLNALNNDTEVAEIRIYENMPVEIVLGDDGGFTTYVWTRHAWIAR